jgi:hypothetical protein
MLFFALPLSIPLPVPPGLTAIPAIPLLIFSIQMLRGMDSPWLPRWVGRKTIKRKTVALMVEKTAPHLKKVEKLLRPRFSFASSRMGERIIGFFGFIFAVSILVPLPFTNFIPAVGITFMSLGLLSKDGVPIVLGMMIGSFGVFVTTLIIFIGKAAAMAVIYSIFPVN